MLRIYRLAKVSTVLLALVLSSCSKQVPPPAPGMPPSQAAASAETKEPLILSAAASTKEVIESLAEQFQAQTETEVKVNPGPSNGLANQILAGAPADLFLSASQQWADEVQQGGKAREMTRLLTNRLVLVVPKGNPGQVREPKDLLSAKVKRVALAGEKVPAGIYADQALTNLDLLKRLTADGKIARGQDVRSALAFVERGEAEAGIVYSTDLSSASGVELVYDFPTDLHDEIVYVLVLLEHGSDKSKGRELYEFLQSPRADEVYAKFGFSRIR